MNLGQLHDLFILFLQILGFIAFALAISAAVIGWMDEQWPTKK